MDPNAKIVYVGGLDEGVTKLVVYSAFSPFGDIKSVDIPVDNQTGKHRGFGFIEFNEAGDATEAIDNMDESELYGKTIRCKLSNRKPAQLRDPKKAAWADEIYYKKVTAMGEPEPEEEHS